MITCFKSLSSDLEQHQYSPPKDDILIDENILRVMHRVGVTPKEYNSDSLKEKLISAIPFGRELFLLSNTEKHSREICDKMNPHCDICQMSTQCDYYNNKNIWKERGTI